MSVQRTIRFAAFALCLGGISLHQPTSLYAQTAQQSEQKQHSATQGRHTSRDTLRSKTAEVRVEGRRAMEHDAANRPVLSWLDEKEVRDLHVDKTSDILRQLPGVYVQDYGGLGGLQTVSLRGMSAAQSAVTLDGVRLNAVQNGLFDFSTLPPYLVQSAQTLDFPDLGSSPSQSLGGSVELQSLSGVYDSLSLQAELRLGEWQDFSAQSALLVPWTEHRSATISALAHSVRGNYPFPFNNFGIDQTVYREHARLQSYAAILSSSEVEELQDNRSTVLLRSTSREVPGAVTQGNISAASAELDDRDLLAIHHHRILLSESMMLSGSAFLHLSSQHYSDTSRGLLGTPIDNRFYARDAGVTTSLRVVDGWQSTWTLSADAQWADVRGDLLRFQSGSYARRTIAGVGLGFSSNPSSIVTALDLVAFAALRFDAATESTPEWNPRVGLSFSPWTNSTLVLSYGSAFRLPSFNELYYQNYGNINLLTERSQNLSLRLNTSHRMSAECSVLAQVEYFHIRTTNQIIAVPRSPIIWSATNVGSVQSDGLECSLQLDIAQHLHLRAQYSVQAVRDAREAGPSAGKQLPYTPMQLAGGSATYTDRAWSVGLVTQWTGQRFQQSDNAPESVLAAFATLALHARYEWQLSDLKLALIAQCDNIGDEHYVVVANFPMPGRQFKLGLEMRL